MALENNWTLKINKWGNSQGIRIPTKMLNQIGILDGEDKTLNATILDNKIVLEPQESTIDKMFKDFDYQKYQKEIRDEHGNLETDWGNPKGREVW